MADFRAFRADTSGDAVARTVTTMSTDDLPDGVLRGVVAGRNVVDVRRAS